MRSISRYAMLVCLLLVCLLLGVSTAKTGSAQEPGGHRVAGSDAKPFTVKVDEYNLDEAPASTTSSSQILKRLLDKKVSPNRTFHFLAYGETESFVRVGERVAIKDDNGSVEFMEVGTVIRMRARLTDDKLIMDFDYTASRLAESERKDANVRITEKTIQTVTELKVGEPALMGGVTAKDGFYLVVTVSE